jgi:hypothetical protein
VSARGALLVASDSNQAKSGFAAVVNANFAAHEKPVRVLRPLRRHLTPNGRAFAR